jgi:hypothetical protein
MKPADVLAWIRFMREHGLKRLAVKDLELELGSVPQSQSTTLEPMAQQGVFEDATGSLCACGHSWITEHAESGCLMGCSHDLCSSHPGAPIV